MTVRARAVLAIVAVVVLQTSLFSRFRVAGAVPDAMLLLAVCAGITGGAERGALVGFGAGIAIDLFLETTPEGLSALVFSLVGYAVGVLVEGTVRASSWVPVVTAAVASAAGEVLFVLAAVVVGSGTVIAPRLAAVALVVGVFNAALAPAWLRLAGWVNGDRVDKRAAGAVRAVGG